MKLIDLIRLLRKHLILLLVAPLFLAGLVIILTNKPDYKFESQTTLYTGIASGSSVEMDKTFNFFATNTAFDNLINVIKSRETQQEVAIRLLSQHLMLEKPDSRYISEKSFSALRRITPSYIYGLVVKNGGADIRTDTINDTLQSPDTFTFTTKVDSNINTLFPSSIDPNAYEQTVKNLMDLMGSSDTNFVYKLLNFPNPHYSIKDISSIRVQRISNSDLVELKYETDDPGICQQTLAILTTVCTKNYKSIKENRSDVVVKYFEFQLKQAADRLKIAEDKLLEFNKDNNIINYYEQSKAVAVVKEDLDVEFNNKRIKLAGLQAAIKRLEEKLGIQQQIQLRSAEIIEKRNNLGDLNYRITSAEASGAIDNTAIQNLANLKVHAENLKEEIKLKVGELYTYGNSTDGLPISTILNDWIDNVIEAENIKAGLEVLGERIKEFQKQYSIYAPAGANIKRIEREISVSEQEFLEILHGLNLAKLKLQDNELSSNIKAVDPPYYPLSPIPTKRKIIVAISAILGFILVFATIFALEYFDDTLKNPAKAEKILNLSFLGVIPKILLTFRNTHAPFIINRLLEITVQNIGLYLKVTGNEKTTKTVIFFSTLSKEGKSVVVANLYRMLKNTGKKVIVLNYEHTAKDDYSDTTQPIIAIPEITSENSKPRIRASLLGRILGYPDSRIDFESPFLNPSYNADNHDFIRYSLDHSFYSAKNYQEILAQKEIHLDHTPDYVLIELPPVLLYPYPVNLFSATDMPVLVCRSNRVWSDADQSALAILKNLTGEKIHFVLNGVALNVIESVIGELPKERSRFRQSLKNIFHFQFFARNQL